MRGKVNLRKRFIFLILCICLSVACTNSDSSTVKESQASSSPASRAAQPGASPASGHDSSAHEQENKMPRLSAEELKRLVAAGRVVIVDVRSPEDYRRAHIQGAINLPLQEIELGRYPKFPRGKRLISYCT
jgi:Rhodanese-like domain